MPTDLDAFKHAYDKWVAESLPDYRTGNIKEIVKKYPLITPDDIPKLISRIKAAGVEVLFLVPV